MDYYGNVFSDTGEYLRTDYNASDAFKNAKTANDALQTAYENSRRASDLFDQGKITDAELGAARAQTDRAAAAYATATGNVSQGAPASHTVDVLTSGPQIFSEPVPPVVALPGPRPETPANNKLLVYGGIALTAWKLFF